MPPTSDALLASIAFVILGSGTLIYGFVNLFFAINSKKWPCVLGEIRKSQLEKQESNDSDATYSAQISYCYSVRDKSYTGSKVIFGLGLVNWRTPLEPFIKKYPIGKAVKVYVSPRNPNHSVLEPGVNLPILFALEVGIVVFTIGVLGVLGLLSAI